MLAVGDSNDIFLFDVTHGGEYNLAHVFQGSNDASFSSDWSGTSDKFAVASQGELYFYEGFNSALKVAYTCKQMAAHMCLIYGICPVSLRIQENHLANSHRSKQYKPERVRLV